MAVKGRVTPGCHPCARCLLLTPIPKHAGNDMLLVMLPLVAVDAAVTTAWGWGCGGGEPGASSLEYAQQSRRMLQQNVHNDILISSVDDKISAQGPFLGDCGAHEKLSEGLSSKSFLP